MPLLFKDYTFTWIIENFSFSDANNGGIIYSPSFVPENIDIREWRIFISQQTYGPKESLSIGVVRISEEVPVTFDLEMQMCNSENEVLCIEKKEKVGFEVRKQNCLLFENCVLKMESNLKDTLILRCRIWENGESRTLEGSLNRSCKMRTTICLDEISCLRKVDYSKSPNRQHSLTFPFLGSQSLKVNIKTQSNEILFEIVPDDKSRFIRKFKCIIFLLDDRGTEKLSCCDIINFSVNLRIWNFPSFLKRSSLEEGTCALFLKFTFAFSNGLKFHDHIAETQHLSLTAPPKSCKSIQATNTLTDDLRKMLFSKDHADVSFSADGEVISAHKNILATRSPTFSAMFNQPMTENKTGVVDILDMDIKTLKLFLEFLYTGELEDSGWERMLALLLAAEKYQVQSLKEECSRFLKLSLSLDSVCDVLSVADMVGEQTLIETALDYIKENVAEVFSSQKWSELTIKNVKLCSEIIYNISQDFKAKKINKS